MKNFLPLLIFLITSWPGQSQPKFKTHYSIFGEGYPVVILNGGPGMNSNCFSDMAKTIAALGFKTIIYDQRGTGKSVLDHLDSTTISMDLMVEDLEHLRQELKIDQWAILGHSFGGLLACHYLSKHPDKVNKLIFSSSGGVNLNFLRSVQNRIQNNLTKLQADSLAFYSQKITQGDTSLSTRKKRAEFLAHAYVFNKNYCSTIASRLMELNPRVNELVFSDLFNINFDHTHKYINNLTPVLVIQGLNDIISPETAIEIKNSFGASKLVLLKQCGHYGWLDTPEEYFDAIQTFLRNGLD